LKDAFKNKDATKINLANKSIDAGAAAFLSEQLAQFPNIVELGECVNRFEWECTKERGCEHNSRAYEIFEQISSAEYDIIQILATMA
jgi:hypothetical protein